MTAAQCSDVVRDALALRRYGRRRWRFEWAPRLDLASVRRTVAYGRGHEWPHVLGLPAYVPDAPLPLPLPDGRSA